MDGEKGGIGVLIGVKPKKGKDDGEDSGGGEYAEAKKAAAKAMMSAFKAGDEDALVEAMDAYLEC